MDMNMDIKDLFAKLKKGNSGSTRTGGGITGFLDKNPKMKIIIPAVLLAISVLVMIVIILTTPKTEINTDITPVNGDIVQNLPQDAIGKDDLDIESGDVLSEVTLDHPKVTAIYFVKGGYSMATIETDTHSYPQLKEGDTINGTEWKVEQITENSVIISLNGEMTELKMATK